MRGKPASIRLGRAVAAESGWSDRDVAVKEFLEFVGASAHWEGVETA